MGSNRNMGNAAIPSRYYGQEWNWGKGGQARLGKTVEHGSGTDRNDVKDMIHDMNPRSSHVREWGKVDLS